MKENLKPCPFCGGEAKLSEDTEERDREYPIWLIACGTCPARMQGERVEILLKSTVIKGDTYIEHATGLRKEYTDEEIQYLNVGRFGKDEKEDLIKAWNKRV